MPTRAQRKRLPRPHGLRNTRRGAVPTGFTLVELMVTIAIIAILAGMAMAALYASQESARAAHTRALVTKLNQALAPRWESYRTRRLPIQMIAGEQPRAFQARQLIARRQLMRIELPDCYQDVLLDVPMMGISLSSDTGAPNPNRGGAWPGSVERHLIDIPRTALSRAYLRRLQQTPSATDTYQGAECLYMILTMGMGDDSGVDLVFSPRDVGDVDGDGMPEFVDGWGRPIGFFRWAPGFVSDMQPVTPGATNPITDRDALSNHDPFDPTMIDPIAFSLYPLIASSGPDGVNGLHGFRRRDLNDPYSPTIQTPDTWTAQRDVGVQNLGGGPEDNIHNHLLELRR